MNSHFLYEDILQEFGRRMIQSTEIPDYLKDNLNPKFELRSYQEEAFARFFLCYKEDFPQKNIRCTSYSTWQLAAVKRSSWQG